jgi:SulP family sulfate permease
VPPHLPAVVIGSLIALAFNYAGFEVDTIYSRFSYAAADGTLAHGIPLILPSFEWPWAHAGPDGERMDFSWAMVRDLLPSAFAIAMLGAIESLLCAVVLDGMTGKRHSANSELLGQGIGNIITPFFGGITATAAIARSAANFKAGAESPVAAMVHALVVLLGLVALAPLLGYLPMPAMAALLIVVAWNMSEAHKSVHLFKTSQSNDRWVFLCCFLLTIMVDMVVAITAGIILAAILFMKEIADMTTVVEITNDQYSAHEMLPKKWRVFKITGPLFFAAADKIFAQLTLYCEKNKGIILFLDGVSILDSGGVSALNKLISHCQKINSEIILTNVQSQPLNTLTKAQVVAIEGVFNVFPTLQNACQRINQSLPSATCLL